MGDPIKLLAVALKTKMKMTIGFLKKNNQQTFLMVIWEGLSKRISFLHNVLAISMVMVLLRYMTYLYYLQHGVHVVVVMRI
jgi:hypothetical protein